MPHHDSISRISLSILRFSVLLEPFSLHLLLFPSDFFQLTLFVSWFRQIGHSIHHQDRQLPRIQKLYKQGAQLMQSILTFFSFLRNSATSRLISSALTRPARLPSKVFDRLPFVSDGDGGDLFRMS